MKSVIHGVLDFFKTYGCKKGAVGRPWKKNTCGKMPVEQNLELLVRLDANVLRKKWRNAKILQRGSGTSQ